MQTTTRRGEPELSEPPIDVDRNPKFCRPVTVKASNYWHALRGGRSMPARSELSPRAMREFLPYVTLVDVVQIAGTGAIDYRISLQGGHCTEVYGHLAHRILTEVLCPLTERRLRYCLDVARDAAGPVKFRSRVTGREQYWLESEGMMAPLGNGPQSLTTLFWVFDTWASPAS